MSQGRWNSHSLLLFCGAWKSRFTFIRWRS